MENLLCDIDVNLSNICRICVCEVNYKDCINLFTDIKESREILRKIDSCFRIVLTYKKYLPCIICDTCVKELNLADNFRIKCQNFDESFAAYCKKIVGSISSDSISLNHEVKFSTNCDDTLDHDESIDLVLDNGSNIDHINVKKEIFGSDCEKLKIDQSSSDGIANFVCTICNKTFKKEKSLLKHNISMHQKRKHVGKVTGFGSTRRYHCTKCLYSTPYSQTLVTHIRRHTGEKPYHCECGKSFTDLSTFNAHKRIHSSETYYTCSTCGKQFKIAKALKQHLRSHETGKYSCEVCHKVLKSRQTLQDHMHRHYNIRNFNCEDCGDTFVTSSELIHHKVKHKLEKNLECHLCGYKTLRRRNLIIHLKRHANDRPHKCECCEASFYSKAEVRRHQRIHTRDKAFQCPSCPKGFTRKPALNKHLQTMHVKEILKIKLGAEDQKGSKSNLQTALTSDSV